VKKTASKDNFLHLLPAQGKEARLESRLASRLALLSAHQDLVDLLVRLLSGPVDLSEQLKARNGKRVELVVAAE
jgi:hypothetical protein